MSSPFDTWLANLPQQQKAAVDALVPGQVGAGPNPGTTGQLDSAPEEATNTNMNLQRFAQAQAPIMANPNADGGLGYSNPAPGTSPSMQMFADVKAATIEAEARKYAFEVYHEIKEANAVSLAGQEARAASHAAGRGAHGAHMSMPSPGHAPGVQVAEQQAAAEAQAKAATVDPITYWYELGQQYAAAGN